MHATFWFGNVKEREHLGNFSIVGMKGPTEVGSGGVN
jgi:hypothetical protein